MKPTTHPLEAALSDEAALDLALSVFEAVIARALEAESADVPEWLKG